MKRAAWTVAILFILGVVVDLAFGTRQPMIPFAVTHNGYASQPAQTFTGIIMKSGQEFMFVYDGTRRAYQIDDQLTASKFDGQRVKVTGTLDTIGNLIRVQSMDSSEHERARRYRGQGLSRGSYLS